MESYPTQWKNDKSYIQFYVTKNFCGKIIWCEKFGVDVVLSENEKEEQSAYQRDDKRGYKLFKPRFSERFVIIT